MLRTLQDAWREHIWRQRVHNGLPLPSTPSEDAVQVPVSGRVYRELNLWAEWGMSTPEALIDDLLREFLAGQERALGNDEQAEEWLEKDGATP